MMRTDATTQPRPRYTAALQAASLLAVLTLAAPDLAAQELAAQELAAQAPKADPIAINQALLSMATPSLWPGFDAKAIPLAIFDGETTYLFRHIKPPQGFEAVPGQSRTSQYKGRHPAVSANTSAEIGGRMCATLMAETAERSSRVAAAVAIHEAFHVFQRQNHPGWQANEFNLLTYPFEDVDALALRLLESDALRRALAAPTTGDLSCWAKAAREIRRERFAKILSEATAYERGSELNEGLARYVQGRAGGEAPDPDATFRAEETRARTYWTGSVLATLLDRLDPAWKTYLEQDDDKNLDALLANAVAANPPKGACGFSANERAAAQGAAKVAIANLESRRQKLRQDLLEGEGWTVIVEASREPLQSAGFDPSNLTVLGGGELLHHRLLNLQNSEGTLEILSQQAITKAAGEHPLAQGISKLIIPALDSEPDVRSEGAVVTIEAEGITGRFEPARLRRTSNSIIIRLGEQAPPKPDNPVAPPLGNPQPPES